MASKKSHWKTKKLSKHVTVTAFEEDKPKPRPKCPGCGSTMGLTSDRIELETGDWIRFRECPSCGYVGFKENGKVHREPVYRVRTRGRSTIIEVADKRVWAIEIWTDDYETHCALHRLARSMRLFTRTRGVPPDELERIDGIRMAVQRGKK